ncbi:MAG TPA: peptidoglycan-binding protein LysM, partial [Blastocatellia bacterium]|nr:peptidoglycan-binding protein LysM [Blastocatellia bacterium]
QFYGNANEYMRIFYANRDKLHDPNKIQVGQELSIPPDTD